MPQRHETSTSHVHWSFYHTLWWEATTAICGVCRLVHDLSLIPPGSRSGLLNDGHLLFTADGFWCVYRGKLEACEFTTHEGVIAISSLWLRSSRTRRIISCSLNSVPLARTGLYAAPLNCLILYICQAVKWIARTMNIGNCMRFVILWVMNIVIS